jgi:hypothetical protein
MASIPSSCLKIWSLSNEFLSIARCFFIKIGVAETNTVKSSNSKVSALIGLCGLNLVIIILDAVEQFGFGDDEEYKRAVRVSEAGLSCAPRVQRQLSQS